MPDSTPNDFSQSSGGDVFSQFLQAPTYFGIDGFPPVTVKTGVVNAFVNGSQTDVTQVFHGLGVIPGYICMACPALVDGGRWVSQIYTALGYDANSFWFYAQDIFGGAHGPGNLGFVFQYLVMGPAFAS